MGANKTEKNMQMHSFLVNSPYILFANLQQSLAKGLFT